MPDGSFFDAANPKFHPLSEMFPLMQGEEYSLLVADIAANGLRDPVIELDHMILDGRNRYRACNEAGVAVRYEAYQGDDPLGFVISTNLHRRHLNVSQRAMIAAKCANLAIGSNQYVVRLTRNLLTGEEYSPPIKVPAAGERARAAGVDRKTLQYAQKVCEGGTPALVQRVERGEVPVSVAAKIADMPQAQQEALADANESVLRNAAKKSRRAKREHDLGDATRAASAALSTKRYSVIYADPPWRFEPYSRDPGLDRAADNHYPTVALDVLKALPVPAADDCVLFMWATAPMMPEALELMAAWGFVYKTQCVWTKPKVGTGYWFRNAHELLLVGTRGQIPAPAPGEQYCSVIDAAVGKHSEKPDAFAEMIEEMFPSQPAIEMFARAPRLGWDVWGNEADAAR